MIRLPALVVAIACITLLPTVVAAQQGPAFYSATPATAPTDAHFVNRNTIWSCDAGICTAAKAADRALFVCERFAKSAGHLTAFSAGDDALDGKALDECNAKAR